MISNYIANWNIIRVVKPNFLAIYDLNQTNIADSVKLSLKFKKKHENYDTNLISGHNQLIVSNNNKMDRI